MKCKWKLVNIIYDSFFIIPELSEFINIEKWSQRKKKKTTCYYETIAIFIRPGIRRKNLRNLLELDNIGYNFI